MEKVVGISMKKLGKVEMEKIYGASGVEPHTTPVISAAIRTSSAKCAGTISAISGLVSYNKDCLG